MTATTADRHDGGEGGHDRGDGGGPALARVRRRRARRRHVLAGRRGRRVGWPASCGRRCRSWPARWWRPPGLGSGRAVGAVAASGSASQLAAGCRWWRGRPGPGRLVAPGLRGGAVARRFVLPARRPVAVGGVVAGGGATPGSAAASQVEAGRAVGAITGGGVSGQVGAPAPGSWVGLTAGLRSCRRSAVAEIPMGGLPPGAVRRQVASCGVSGWCRVPVGAPARMRRGAVRRPWDHRAVPRWRSRPDPRTAWAAGRQVGERLRAVRVGRQRAAPAPAPG